MTNLQTKNLKTFHEMIKTNFSTLKVVKLSELTKSIAKVSNVRVRECSVKDYYELGVSDINDDGVLTIPANPKKHKPANHSAIESQRLHVNDIIFGYRGKMGKVGVVAKEFEMPVVTHSGMIRIVIADNRSEETSRYIQAYLSSKLVRTYLNSMLDDRNQKKTLDVEVVAHLPIPYFDEMEGMAKFSTILNRRRTISVGVRKLIEQAQILLHLYEDMESESFVLQTFPNEQLNLIAQNDSEKEVALDTITTQLQMLKNYQSVRNILAEEFISNVTA